MIWQNSTVRIPGRSLLILSLLVLLLPPFARSECSLFLLNVPFSFQVIANWYMEIKKNHNTEDFFFFAFWQCNKIPMPRYFFPVRLLFFSFSDTRVFLLARKRLDACLAPNNGGESLRWRQWRPDWRRWNPNLCCQADLRGSLWKEKEKGVSKNNPSRTVGYPRRGFSLFDVF